MLILFDQATPVPIRPFLREHTVQTAAQKGWDRLKNGELLQDLALMQNLSAIIVPGFQPRHRIKSGPAIPSNCFQTV